MNEIIRKTEIARICPVIKFGQRYSDPRHLYFWDVLDHNDVIMAKIWRDQSDDIYLVQPENSHPFGAWIILNTQVRMQHYGNLNEAKAGLKSEFEAFVRCVRGDIAGAQKAREEAEDKGVICESLGDIDY